MYGPADYLFSAAAVLWAGSCLFLGFMMVRLTHLIRKRSPRPKRTILNPEARLNVWHVLRNTGVAGDAPTQALRQRLTAYVVTLLAISIAFALLVVLPRALSGGFA